MLFQATQQLRKAYRCFFSLLNSSEKPTDAFPRYSTAQESLPMLFRATQQLRKAYRCLFWQSGSSGGVGEAFVCGATAQNVSGERFLAARSLAIGLLPRP
jgi:hypothetical protein